MQQPTLWQSAPQNPFPLGPLSSPTYWHRRLLRARRERPRRSSATEQRDELAAPQPIKLHSISHQPIEFAGYRISNGQSAGLRTVSRNIGSLPLRQSGLIFRSLVDDATA